MSVTVIRLSDNAVINYSKGADSEMKKLLNNRNALEKNTIEELEVYNSTGYRTLMFGKREVPNELKSV